MQKLTKADYESAISVQDACNLSGVVQSWGKMMSKIWAEAYAARAGTEFVNEHPINVLFASKVASLTGCEAGISFASAYERCEKQIMEMA